MVPGGAGGGVEHGNIVFGTSQMYGSGVVQAWGIQPCLFSERLLM
jgi:hypothetical protein